MGDSEMEFYTKVKKVEAKQYTDRASGDAIIEWLGHERAWWYTKDAHSYSELKLNGTPVPLSSWVVSDSEADTWFCTADEFDSFYQAMPPDMVAEVTFRPLNATATTGTARRLPTPFFGIDIFVD